MKANDLERLIFSPFHTSRILHHFLSGVNSVTQKSIKTELIYLVLPFIYFDLTQKKLQNLNKNSKFNPFMNNKEFEIFVSTLNERINNYRRKTNTALILLANDIELEFTDFVNLNVQIHFNSEKDIYLKPLYKSAYNLGVILGKEQYLSVFKKLRITDI